MIFRQAVRNLLANKLRLVLTSLAVVLGVGFVVGALVLGDTINKAFDGVFATASNGVSVEVRGVKTVSESDRQPVPASLLATIRALDGVGTAAGAVSGPAEIIGSNGKAAGLQGPPALGFSWSHDPKLNPLRITSGTPPRSAGDVVIDRTTANREHFSTGRRIRIVTASGSAEYRLVGIVSFGSQNNLAGATLAAFALPTAQRIFDSVGRFSSIEVTARAGVTDAVLAARIQAALPAGYGAITGQASAKEQSNLFKKFVDIFRNFLLAFAAIALFVGSFIIFNAFKITVAQRTRQLGLLRAIGASESQIVRSVLLEAGFIGLVASTIGVAFGIAFAALLRAGFNAIGASLPPTTLQVAPRSVIVGLAVGMLVTFVSAVVPAVKASRVPPMAAMRDLRLEGSARGRLIGSIVLAASGTAFVLFGSLASRGGLSQRFSLIGLGAMLLFVGSAMLTQYVAHPLAWIIGAPMARMGLAGRLGQGNAMRNPARTAQTAAALTIGVALVTGVTIFAASLNATFVGSIDKRVRADLIVLGSNQQPFSAAAAAALSRLPELSAVSEWRTGEFKDARGHTHAVAGLDPAQLANLYDPGVTDGSFRALTRPGTIAVQKGYASSNRLRVGSTMSVFFAKTSKRQLRVVGIFTDETFAPFFVSQSEYDRNFSDRQDEVILARTRAGVTPQAGKAVVETRLKDFPNLDVRTKPEYKALISGQINRFLRLFYVLLAMAVVIAIFGIVLTLALSVFERTREIGLLRAVGLSRRSVRAMIRWEAIIVALIGALVGLVLGVFLGVVSISAIPLFKVLAIPWPSMIVFLIAAAAFGVLAAILPARRAARLNILEAIQSE